MFHKDKDTSALTRHGFQLPIGSGSRALKRVAAVLIEDQRIPKKRCTSDGQVEKLIIAVERLIQSRSLTGR